MESTRLMQLGVSRQFDVQQPAANLNCCFQPVVVQPHRRFSCQFRQAEVDYHQRLTTTSLNLHQSVNDQPSNNRSLPGSKLVENVNHIWTGCPSSTSDVSEYSTINDFRSSSPGSTIATRSACMFDKLHRPSPEVIPNAADWPMTVNHVETSGTDWSEYISSETVQAARANYRGEVPLSWFTPPHTEENHTPLNTIASPPRISNSNDVKNTTLTSQTAATRVAQGKSRIKHKCEYCVRVFTSSSDYKRHLAVHTGEKPFTCSQCGYRFSLKHNMTRHLRKIHGGNDSSNKIVNKYVKYASV